MRIEQTRRREQGFSLVEMLIVVGIIAIVATISLPNIIQYLRHYRLRGAADEFVGELQTARMTAVKKNVNFGVLFIILSPTTYRYVVEDGQIGPAEATQYGLTKTTGLGRAVTMAEVDAADAAAPNRHLQAGAVRTLPAGLVFDAGKCSIAGNGNAVRFSRLGLACQAGALGVGCPPAVAGGENQLAFAAAGGQTHLCIHDTVRDLARCITMTDGGRARSGIGDCP